MPVVYLAIDQIENVTEDNRRKRHAAPVLTEAIHAEGLGNESWVNAEEEAIGEASQTRQEAKSVRIINLGPTDLGEKKNCAGYEEAPKTAHSQLPDNNVRANTWANRISFGFQKHTALTYRL